MKTAVAYLRRSTKDKQKHSFERQRASILNWARSNDIQITSWFQESVSGKLGLEHRPQLVEAFATGLPVVVSSVDRLSRDVAIGSSILKERKVVVAELGLDVDSFILNVLLALAEAEQRRLSRRVKQGLQAAKARGVVLGNPRLDEARIKGHQACREKGDRTAKAYIPMVQRAQDAGCVSSYQIAAYLNDFGVKSPRGKAVSPKLIQRILTKMEK